MKNSWTNKNNRCWERPAVVASARRAHDAVARTRVDEVRRVGEVGARIDVGVAGGHDEVVGGLAREVRRDVARRLRAAGDRERPALAEVVLDVDDDQRPLA